MILYKLHVRGYTKANRTITGTKGTFQALEEMIPYWKELGINTIELMPAYEFMESSTYVRILNLRKWYLRSIHRDVLISGDICMAIILHPRDLTVQQMIRRKEFKTFIKKLHQAGIACIMEMYFPRECNPVTALRALQS